MQGDDSDHEGGVQNIDPHTIPPYSAISPPDLVRILSYSQTNCKYYIWYEDRPSARGGPVLGVARFTLLGFNKIVSKCFPPTKDGWLAAWRTLAAMDPQAFEKCLATVTRYGARYGIEHDTQAFLGESTFLGGYTPCANLTRQRAYDLRFMNDQLKICNVGTIEARGSLKYVTFKNVQITGPGMTQSPNPFADPAGKIIGAAISAAQPNVNANIINVADSVISTGLKAAGTRDSTKTVLFVQTTDSELFFLYTKAKPDQLRIDLSPALGKIREVLSSPGTNSQSDQRPDAASIINQLKDASTLLDRGLITRDEFERLKSQLLSGD